LDSVLVGTLQKYEFKLREGDIVCVASKVVSIAEKRIVNLKRKRISNTARRLASKYSMNGQLAQIVLEQADSICGGVRGFLLTVKQGILTANAGVDVKNSPTGTATLWPVQPDNSASRLRASLMRHAKVGIGVVIVDSRVTPLRLGTVGIAIGISGFTTIRDDRGKRDLYGRRVMVTQSNLADDLASAAHLVMGEREERKGLAVIRNAPVTLTNTPLGKLTLDARDCLIASSLFSPDSAGLKP
jgi:coenzyme F420-0:L-glutamate ligase/coenzyme F420-1:gamma-L-glutamate ligase